MNSTELVQQIEKIEKNLNNPNLPDSAKAKLKERVEKLKADLKEAEKGIEKKEEKLEKEEKKVQSDVQDEIAKLEKNLNNPNLPDSVKEVMRKKIAAAKEKLAEQKQEIKEDKKEAAEEKKEIKQAVKEVEKVAKEVEKVAKQEKEEDEDEKPKKSVRKKPIKKAIKKPVVREKKRAERSEKRKKEMRKIATELSALIEKNKKLRKKYEGQGVDLDRDAGRSAKPFGYRFKGKKDYRVPTELQIKLGLKRGTIDYEARPNRSDVYPKGYKGKIKLEEGGMMKKGGDVQGKVTDRAKDGQKLAKPTGWRWKDSAIDIVGKVKASKTPSKFMRAKYPEYVYWEGRPDKSDKNPSKKYISL